MIRAHQPALYVTSLPAIGYDGQEVFLDASDPDRVVHYRWSAPHGRWQLVAPSDPNRIGEITINSATTLPPDCRWCDGAEVLRGSYPALAAKYQADGFRYGAGNGTTTFKLPDMRQRMPYGTANPATAAQLGATGGAATHALSVSEMPSHDHVSGSGPYVKGLTYSTLNNVANTGNQTLVPRNLTVTTDNLSFHRTDVAGGGAAHNNLPPYLAVPFMVRVL